MSPPARAAIPRFTRNLALPLVVVTAAGLVKAASTPSASPSPRALVTLVTLGAAYALLGTVAMLAVERRGRRGHLRLVLAAAFAVGSAAVLLSHGHASLLLLALVSQAVLYLGPGAVVLTTTACVAATAAGYALDGGAALRLARATANFGAAVAFVLVFSRAVLAQVRARAEIERLADELGAANARLRDYARDVDELATARERNRIAREIHDGIGHYLTVVHVQLEAAQATFAPAPDQARAAIATARELTREGLGEVRRSVALLREAPAPLPLAAVLEKLARAQGVAGLAVAVEVAGRPRPLPAPIALALERAAQEALTNVRRHACAAAVAVVLDYGAGAVRLRVRDDGIGAAGVPAGGFGLVGLRERAALLGGRVDVTTAPGRGFALEVELPL